MHLKTLFGLAGLALACLTPLFSADPGSSRWEQWMRDYYRDPQPDLVVSAAHGLGTGPHLQQPGATATAIGFFSQVFAQNPDRVDTWFAHFRHLPQDTQRMLAAALWYSGHPQGEQILLREARSSDQRAALARLVARAPDSVRSTPVVSESSMNLQWGAFLATGDDTFVNNILAALGRDEVGDAARLSLAFKAAEHPRVLEIVRTQLDRQPNEVRPALRAVINDAERAVPSS